MHFDSKAFIKTLTPLPGVYRMVDAAGTVLYVGKARNLKRRVASYFRNHHSSAKTRSLMAHTQAVEVTVTHTEAEALILENTLIKQFKPRYNILLRDDKGYPYIHLSDDDFPVWPFIEVPGKHRDVTLAPTPMPTPFGKHCICCIRYSGFVNVRTVFSATAAALVCSTRSNAVPRPAPV